MLREKWLRHRLPVNKIVQLLCKRKKDVLWVDDVAPYDECQVSERRKKRSWSCFHPSVWQLFRVHQVFQWYQDSPLILLVMSSSASCAIPVVDYCYHQLPQKVHLLCMCVCTNSTDRRMDVKVFRKFRKNGWLRIWHKDWHVYRWLQVKLGRLYFDA